MELDHVFMFVEPDGPEIELFKSAGFLETYRRTHAGQGTENVCFCFKNFFFEFLWVTDPVALRSEAISRTGLYERSRWRDGDASPFGVAWREPAGSAVRPVPTWPFKPPYLPAGTAIDVAVDGDDPRQPMMFKSPGTAPPALWPSAKRGVLQRPAGLGDMLAVTLRMPEAVSPSRTLRALATSTILKIEFEGAAYSVLLQVERLTSENPLVVKLPI